VDVSSLISTTVDLLIRDTALSEIDIQVEGASPPVVADPELLKIVFQNLIVNGAQAMRGKGRIRVSIGASDVVCEVRFMDAGPGIPPDIRQKIFTPFFTTKARGTGLGLPTARRLIEAHRGTIHVECPPAGGTTVTIQLPVEPAAASARAGGPVLERGLIEP
jgi:signal transduction histidine kinase